MYFSNYDNTTDATVPYNHLFSFHLLVSGIENTGMTSKHISKVVTHCLDGVDVQAVLKDKKRRLFQTQQRNQWGSQSTPDNDGHNDSRIEDQLPPLNNIEEKSSKEQFMLCQGKGNFHGSEGDKGQSSPLLAVRPLK